MTLKQQLVEDMKAAMKGGDKHTLGVVRLINAAIKQREVDERIELDDAAVIVAMEKMVKQRKDSVSQFEAANREDLAAVERAEIVVIEKYLPAKLGEAEILAAIDAAIAETGATGPADMGKLMGALKPKLAGQADMGLVSARSDWSGDESMVVFKCGPFIGHEAVQEFDYDPGGGHVHPDANHFLIFGGGEWLIRDDGYASKMTAQHNTLLVDGKGQMGEAHWFAGGALMRLKDYARIEKAASQPALDHIIGDATAAYAPQSGLKKYRRHLLYLKPNVLLVLDDIQTDKHSKLELRFHPEQKTAVQDGKAFVCRSEKTALRVEPLTLDGVTATAEDTDQIDRNNKALPMFTIRLQAEKQAWRNATALSWCKAGEDPIKVSLQVDGDRWTFTAGETTVLFVWDKEAASVE